jgi:hypothetical protein
MQVNFISRALFGLFLLVLPLAIAYSQPDPANYHLIYGNRDGSPIQAVIGSRIEIQAWGATAAGDMVDSITYIHMPLSSNDSIISQRLGGYFVNPFLSHWDDGVFHSPNANCPIADWTNQSMEAFAFVGYPRDPEYFFWTNGDTVPLCTYIMETCFDTLLAGQTITPFMEGWLPPNVDLRLLWGFVNGVDWVAPVTTYPFVQFLSSSEVGYIQGHVFNESSDPIGGALVRAEGTLRVDTTDIDGKFDLDWLLPGSYNLIFAMAGYFDRTIMGTTALAGDTTFVDITMFHSGACIFTAGDINGDRAANGIDVVYGVSYFKGGNRPPQVCDCPPHGSVFVSGDVNGNCQFDGLDIAYFVNYLKGFGPAPLGCPDCGGRR